MVKKLNLGCGESYKQGYVNVDFHEHVKQDIVHDLNVLPYPFKDNEFDMIEASHILEHLDKPLFIMKEFHRILKAGGELHIKVPHCSRGFTHSEHKAGFDVTFPYYFDHNFSKSGYYGVDFKLKSMELHWMAFFHLMPYMGINRFTVFLLKILNSFINFFAKLSPQLCSRIWCYWVGGFEEIEFKFIAIK